jgi:hypothetical protein
MNGPTGMKKIWADYLAKWRDDHPEEVAKGHFPLPLDEADYEHFGGPWGELEGSAMLKLLRQRGVAEPELAMVERDLEHSRERKPGQAPLS